MKTTRLTILALFSVLLMHTGGVLLSLHGAAHRSDHAPAAHACEGDHGDPDPGENPLPLEHEDCSICLGLSGLHLIAGPEPAALVIAPVLIEPERPRAISTRAPPAQCSNAPRAPPVC